MRNILTDFSPGVLARAIEENGTDCCLSWAEWPEMDLGQNETMVWTLTDVPFAFFNNVFNSRLANMNVQSAIEQTVSMFRQRNVSMFWWTGPTTQPSDLGEHLLTAGLVHGFQASAMAVDMEEIREADPPLGVTIEEVTNTESLQQWCDVMTHVYEFPDFAVGPWFRMLTHLGVGSEKRYRHFIARADGRPVATASIYFAAGVAGVSSVATLAEYRRQGIGGAITRASLRAAREVGFRIGVLFSSSMGESVYKKLGFKVYGKGDCYVWSCDGDQEMHSLLRQDSHGVA